MIVILGFIIRMFPSTFFFFFICLWNEPIHEIPKTGFWAMEGNLRTHSFKDSIDSLSGPEIFELRDSQNLTLWFGRYIFKDVCVSGECKMLKIWLFWDGAGNYLGLQSPVGETLTKSDHDEFLPEDYAKLNGILQDPESILKTLEQEDLIIIPENVDLITAYDVDGITAATQPSLAEVVVENAVYTCYTLWHTVYGPVRDQILKLIEARIDYDYLNMMLESENPQYVISAIQHIGNNLEFIDIFDFKILELIKTRNIQIADQALAYFNSDKLESEIIQTKLIKTMQEADVSFNYKILWKLIEKGEMYDQAIIDLLHFFSKKKQNVHFFNLSLKLITPKQLKESEEIRTLIFELGESKVSSIRNSISRFLNNIEVAEM